MSKIKHVEYEKKEVKVKPVKEKLKLVKNILISENKKKGTSEIVLLYETGEKNKKGEVKLKSVTKHISKGQKVEEVNNVIATEEGISVKEEVNA